MENSSQNRKIVENPKTPDPRKNRNSGNDAINSSRSIPDHEEDEGEIEEKFHENQPEYIFYLAIKYIAARRFDQAEKYRTWDTPHVNEAIAYQVYNYFGVDQDDYNWITRYEEDHGHTPGSISFGEFSTIQNFYNIRQWTLTMQDSLPAAWAKGKLTYRKTNGLRRIQPFGWKEFKAETPTKFRPTPGTEQKTEQMWKQRYEQMEQEMWRLSGSPNARQPQAVSTAIRNPAPTTQGEQLQTATHNDEGTGNQNEDRSEGINFSTPSRSASRQCRRKPDGELDGPDRLMDRAMGPHRKSEGHSRKKGYAPSELETEPKRDQNGQFDRNLEVAEVEGSLEYQPRSPIQSRNLGPQTENQPCQMVTPPSEEMAEHGGSTSTNGIQVDHRRTDHVPIATIPVAREEERTLQKENRTIESMDTDNIMDSLNSEEDDGRNPGEPDTKKTRQHCNPLDERIQEEENTDADRNVGMEPTLRPSPDVAIFRKTEAFHRKRILIRMREQEREGDQDESELQRLMAKKQSWRKERTLQCDRDVCNRQAGPMTPPRNSDHIQGWAIPATPGSNFQDEAPTKAPTQEAVYDINSDGEDSALQWSRSKPTIEHTHDIPDWEEPELETEKTVHERVEPQARRRVHFKNRTREKDPFIPKEKELVPYKEGPTTTNQRLAIAIAMQPERAYQGQRRYRPSYYATEIKEIIDEVTGDHPEWPDDANKTCGAIEGEISHLNNLPNAPKIPIGRREVDTHIRSGMTEYMRVPEGEKLADATQALAEGQPGNRPIHSSLQEDLPYRRSGAGFAPGHRRSRIGPKRETDRQSKTQILAASGQWTDDPEPVHESRYQRLQDIEKLKKWKFPKDREKTPVAALSHHGQWIVSPRLKPKDEVRFPPLQIAAELLLLFKESVVVMRDRYDSNTAAWAIKNTIGWWLTAWELYRNDNKCQQTDWMFPFVDVHTLPGEVREACTAKYFKGWTSPKVKEGVSDYCAGPMEGGVPRPMLFLLRIATLVGRFHPTKTNTFGQLKTDMIEFLQAPSVLRIWEQYQEDCYKLAAHVAEPSAMVVRTTPSSMTEEQIIKRELLQLREQVEKAECRMIFMMLGENTGELQNTSQIFKDFMKMDASRLFDAGTNDRGASTKKYSNGTILPIWDKLVEMERLIDIIRKDPGSSDLVRSEEDHQHLMELKANFIRVRLSERVGSIQDHPNRLRDRQRLIKDTALIIPLLMCWSTGHMLGDDANDGTTVIEVRSIFKAIASSPNPLLQPVEPSHTLLNDFPVLHQDITNLVKTTCDWILDRVYYKMDGEGIQGQTQGTATFSLMRDAWAAICLFQARLFCKISNWTLDNDIEAPVRTEVILQFEALKSQRWRKKKRWKRWTAEWRTS